MCLSYLMTRLSSARGAGNPKSGAARRALPRATAGGLRIGSRSCAIRNFLSRSASVSGMTLIEILVGLGITSVTVMAAMYVLIFFKSQSHRLDQQTSDRLDLAVIDKYIFRDILGAQPSIGNIKFTLPDGSNFFDFYGDTPISSLPKASQSRTFTMDGSVGGNIDLVVGVEKSESKFYYQPFFAYQDTFPLTFANLDKNLPMDTIGFFSKFLNDPFSKGSHFYFYSPALLRIPTTAKFHKTRYYSFLGYFSGKEFLLEGLDGRAIIEHPLYPGRQMKDIDTFFRWLPPIGGAMSTVLVMPAQVVRYELRPSGPGSKVGKLYRMVKHGRTFQNETLLSTNIVRINFIRPNVTSSLIKFELDLKR